MKKSILLVALTLVAWTAAGQRGRVVSTPVRVSYMLPRTGLAVEVTAERAERVPGPLEAHAAALLGVTPGGAAVTWRLLSLRVTPVAVPDPRGMYTLNLTGEHGWILPRLTPEGFLAGIGAATGDDDGEAVSPPALEYTAGESGAVDLEYVRFGIDPPRKEVLDSNFSTIEVDGVPRRVWDPIERHVLKDRDELASDAARALFEIRRDRLEALSAPGGVPAGSLEALDRLEADYLALFLGTRETRVERRVFLHVPEREGESVPLFRFSPTLGFTGLDNVAATPYLVEVVDVLVPGQPVTGETRVGITYRVPATGNARVRRGEAVLVEGRLVIAQLGYLQQFPLDVIGSEGLSLDFHPASGSLKRVHKSR